MAVVLSKKSERGSNSQVDPGEIGGLNPDKAYAELLQEVRVAQTGVQFLLGFLMTFAFSPRFETLSEAQTYQYVATLITAFSAAACLTAPAPFHRVVFRHGLRSQLLAVSNRMAIVGLALLMIAMSSAMLLIVTMAMGSDASRIIASATFSGIIWLWFGMPMWHRLRYGKRLPVGGAAEAARANSPSRPKGAGRAPGE
ncbi:DUF6328 family protein [Streptomyces sp. NPDC020681]|uniref:DUF6328 family protein n=1 Tax=Streptomyces sp. NPDC020681 TaxID=3365083 RepID=UPI0037A8FFBF